MSPEFRGLWSSVRDHFERRLVAGEARCARYKRRVAVLDETPFQQGTSQAWIWAFVATTFTYFTLRLTRAAEVLGPSVPGVIVTDRETGDHF